MSQVGGLKEGESISSDYKRREGEGEGGTLRGLGCAVECDNVGGIRWPTADRRGPECFDASFELGGGHAALMRENGEGEASDVRGSIRIIYRA